MISGTTTMCRLPATRTMAAATVTALLLLGAGCGGDEDAAAPDTTEMAEDVGSVAEEAPATTTSTTTTSTSTAPAPAGAAPGPSELTFVYSDEPGEEACRYEGPSEVTTSIATTLQNVHPTDPILVSMARLADDATVEDWHAHLADLGDTFPVEVPPEEHDAAAHEWMQGEWLELHVAGPQHTQTVEREALFEGRYVAFCWRDNPDGAGSILWPAGTLTVRK